MKINQDQLILGVCKYFENEIISKAPNGFEKFKMGFVYGGLKNKLPTIISNLRENPIMTTIDVFDADGFLDVDIMMKYAKESLEKSGKITISNLIFSNEDLNSIYNYLKEV